MITKKSGTITMLLAGVLFIAPTVWAGDPQSPGVDARQERQQQRIDQGVGSGALTTGETARVERQQGRIQTEEQRFKSDGHRTAGERAKLQHDQNRASRHIARAKHNERRAP